MIDATSAGPIPLDGGNSLARYGPLEAATDPAKFQQATTLLRAAGLLRVRATPIVAGRAFSDADNRPEARVIIIDELIAAQLFPNGGAIGQRMLARVITDEAETFEVIGVVKHQRHTTMMDDGEEGMYLPGRLRTVRRGVPLGRQNERRSRSDCHAVRSALARTGSPPAAHRTTDVAVLSR